MSRSGLLNQWKTGPAVTLKAISCWHLQICAAAAAAHRLHRQHMGLHQAQYIGGLLQRAADVPGSRNPSSSLLCSIGLLSLLGLCTPRSSRTCALHPLDENQICRYEAHLSHRRPGRRPAAARSWGGQCTPSERQPGTFRSRGRCERSEGRLSMQSGEPPRQSRPLGAAAPLSLYPARCTMQAQCCCGLWTGQMAGQQRECAWITAAVAS